MQIGCCPFRHSTDILSRAFSESVSAKTNLKKNKKMEGDFKKKMEDGLQKKWKTTSKKNKKMEDDIKIWFPLIHDFFSFILIYFILTAQKVNLY